MQEENFEIDYTRKATYRPEWRRSTCLLLAETPEGWRGLYCFQGRETPAETAAAYLNSCYPDGLVRLYPLGDLITLGAAPEECERMDADGEYAPARDPDYPPPAWPDWDEALDMWMAIHGLVHFAVRWRRITGWEAVVFGGGRAPRA